MPESGTLARVVFDEAHSEAWTIRPELAREMQPAHPGDSSYARAAAVLATREFTVAPNVDQPLSTETLRECDVLVIAHPSDPAWERTTGNGSPRLSGEELDAIKAFVAQGGGLIVLGETEQEKYGNNLNELLGALRPAPGERHRPGLRALPRRAELDPGRPAAGRSRARRRPARAGERGLPLPARRRSVRSNGARGARPHPRHCVGPEPPADRGHASTARVAWSCWPTPICSAMTASTSSTTAALWLNIVYWVARSDGGTWPVQAARGEAGPEQTRPGSRCATRPTRWPSCRRPDGSLDGGSRRGPRPP